MSYLYASTCFIPFSAQLYLLLGELEDTPDPRECLSGLWVSVHDIYKCLDELGSVWDQPHHGGFAVKLFLSYYYVPLFSTIVYSTQLTSW